MKKAAMFLGSALAAASLALAAPAAAAPAPTAGSLDAASAAAAAPGSLGTVMQASIIRAQGFKSHADGARIGFDDADGSYDHAATDGTTIQSAFYKPSL